MTHADMPDHQHTEQGPDPSEMAQAIVSRPAQLAEQYERLATEDVYVTLHTDDQTAVEIPPKHLQLIVDEADDTRFIALDKRIDPDESDEDKIGTFKRLMQETKEHKGSVIGVFSTAALLAAFAAIGYTKKHHPKK